MLGSGPGGYTAAFRAADLGLKVCLIERYSSLGGVCLNVGCIPSKALLHAARVIEETRGMRAHGIDFGEPSIDLPQLGDWKDKVVSQLTGGLSGLAKKRKVAVINGIGRFTSAHELTVTRSGAEPDVCVPFKQASSRPLNAPSRIADMARYDTHRVRTVLLPPRQQAVPKVVAFDVESVADRRVSEEVVPGGVFDPALGFRKQCPAVLVA